MSLYKSRSAVSTLSLILIVAVTAVVVVAAVFFSGYWPFPTGPVTGSGKLVTKEKTFSDFTAVEAEEGFEVEITQSSSYRISITADGNVINKIQVSKKGETLHIGLKPGVYKKLTLKAKITMPELNMLQLFTGSHGFVNGFSSDWFVLGLFGGSHVDMEGSANDLTISASGGSHFELSEFPVHDANVDIDGGSHGTINLDGRLDADLSGGSHLSYIGEPTMGDIKTSGGSKLEQK